MPGWPGRAGPRAARTAARRTSHGAGRRGCGARSRASGEFYGGAARASLRTGWGRIGADGGHARVPRDAAGRGVARGPRRASSPRRRLGHHARELDALREQHALALRIHEQMDRQRSREAELTALYETARDLTAIRDLDAILAAIVRRARQLLHADMTYLSLNDEAEGASYMKVTDGALTPEFRGCGCRSAPACSAWWPSPGRRTSPRTTRPTSGSCTATTSTPPSTASRSAPSSGCPLTVEGTVIGALLAVHRTVRPFPAGEVALLTSFAAHAAVALENARLFEQARAAVAAADEANAELRARNRGDRARGARPRPAHRRAAARGRRGRGRRRAGGGARRQPGGVRRRGPPARRGRGADAVPT